MKIDETELQKLAEKAESSNRPPGRAISLRLKQCAPRMKPNPTL
jgi:hypothetical protein